MVSNSAWKIGVTRVSAGRKLICMDAEAKEEVAKVAAVSAAATVAASQIPPTLLQENDD